MSCTKTFSFALFVYKRNIMDGCFRTRCVESLNSVSGAINPSLVCFVFLGDWISPYRELFCNNGLNACVCKYLYAAFRVLSIKRYLHWRDQISLSVRLHFRGNGLQCGSNVWTVRNPCLAPRLPNIFSCIVSARLFMWPGAWYGLFRLLRSQ